MTTSSMLAGMTASPVTITTGTVGEFRICGVSEAAAKDTRIRIRAAITNAIREGINIGFSVLVEPDCTGGIAHLDLAIAVEVLKRATGYDAASTDTLLLGELSLLGDVMRIRGTLAHLLAAHRRGVRSAIVPQSNAHEAAIAVAHTGMDIRLARNLSEVWSYLSAPQLPKPVATLQVQPTADDYNDHPSLAAVAAVVFSAVRSGQNILLVGTPGAGKTMLARRARSALPPMSDAETLECQTIASISGLPVPAPMRPFRAPHHTASDVAIVGGGDPARPGEVTLAHNGVLFLDELPEFRRTALEALCGVVKDGVSTIVRRGVNVTFPASPVIIAAMNPCPCGYAGGVVSSRVCACSPERRDAYVARVAGLVDRLKMVRIEVPPFRAQDYVGK